MFFVYAENCIHAVSKQIWFIREEGSASRSRKWSVFIFWKFPWNCDLIFFAAGPSECMWVVQGLPASFNWKTGNWACIRVSIFFFLLSKCTKDAKQALIEANPRGVKLGQLGRAGLHKSGFTKGEKMTRAVLAKGGLWPSAAYWFLLTLVLNIHWDPLLKVVI